MRNFMFTTCLALAAALGCAGGSTEPDSSESAATPSMDGSAYLLVSEPALAANVIQVREEAKDQDDVVIVGRIGGSENPWVAGRAAFSIVDLSLKSCADIGSDGCPKPWDFC